METFAPAYFDYMSSAVTANVSTTACLLLLAPNILHQQRPTLLAKVFGCYKLTFGKPHSHKSTGKWKPVQMNLLVMENLFYDRRFSKVCLHLIVLI